MEENSENNSCNNSSRRIATYQQQLKKCNITAPGE
jgi:hypothetical protein